MKAFKGFIGVPLNQLEKGTLKICNKKFVWVGWWGKWPFFVIQHLQPCMQKLVLYRFFIWECMVVLFQVVTHWRRSWWFRSKNFCLRISFSENINKTFVLAEFFTCEKKLIYKMFIDRCCVFWPASGCFACCCGWNNYFQHFNTFFPHKQKIFFTPPVLQISDFGG